MMIEMIITEGIRYNNDEEKTDVMKIPMILIEIRRRRSGRGICRRLDVCFM